MRMRTAGSVADDHIAAAQGWLDRLIRRLRRGGPPRLERRRRLTIQIVGRSGAVYEQARARAHRPNLRRRLDGGGIRRTDMSVGLPTSTPAFQIAAMYGVKPDIPGFHYHARRRRDD